MIPGYKEGSDITLLNTFYQNTRRSEDGKRLSDILTIVYEDNVTGKKNHVDIENPDYEYYKIKDEIVTDYNRLFIDKDKCEKIVVPYKSLLKSISLETGRQAEFKANIEQGNFSANKILHTDKRIMNSDMDIEDHYRMRFSRLYKNEPKLKLKKAFFDIETDNIKDSSDFPELGMFPVNALTYINEYKKEIKVLLLRTSVLPNPQIKEFEDEISKDPKAALQELKDFVIEKVGGYKKAKRYGLLDYTFEYMFFDEEIELIGTLFFMVNNDEPDFMLAWNMPFDIPYLIERCITLGYDPASIMSHPSMQYPFVYYYIDNEHTEFHKKGSMFKIAGHTVYIDQLVNFASRRSGTKYPNYKLDSIGYIVSKVRKLDYSHLTTRVPELSYKSYKTFVFYNVMDTIVQLCVEHDTKDLEYMYNKCNINFTRYEKCHRQTIFLTNRATDEFYKQGYIIGNNYAKFKKKEGKYPGAIVHDPLNTDDTYKLNMGGFKVPFVRNADDFDFKSLYPSEDLQHNIAVNTQIGKIIIDNMVHDRENIFNVEKYDRGGIFLEDFHSGNIIEFCKRWLHFAGYKEIMDDIMEYFMYISPQGNYFYIFGNKPRPMVMPQYKVEPRPMVKTLNSENNVPRNMVGLLYNPLDKNVYDNYIEEKRIFI